MYQKHVVKRSKCLKIGKTKKRKKEVSNAKIRLCHSYGL